VCVIRSIVDPIAQHVCFTIRFVSGWSPLAPSRDSKLGEFCFTRQHEVGVGVQQFVDVLQVREATVGDVDRVRLDLL